MIIFRFLLLFLYLFISAPAEATEPSSQTTGCGDGFSLNYTLPMLHQCKEREYKNRSMIQTIPKLIPSSPAEEVHCRRKSKIGIHPGSRVCRFPDCLSNPCVSGWCEENMTDYQCHCPPGYSGKRCQKTTGLGSAKEEPGMTSINASSNTDTAINTAGDAVKAPNQLECNDTTSTNNDPCPQSWQQFEGYCYQLHQDRLGFHDARNRCRMTNLDHGHADLASIHSEQENDFIWALSQPLSQHFSWRDLPWIGFYRPIGGPSDPFVWSDGTDVNFTFWGDKQPDDSGSIENCAGFWFFRRWNDMPCVEQLPFVCKTTTVP